MSRQEPGKQPSDISYMAFIIILMAVGILLILTEILLIPGVGIAGISGVLALGGSCFYAFSEFGQSVGTIVTVFNVVLIVSLTVYVLRAKTWKKLALNTNIDSKVNIISENAVEVGDCGRTVTRLAPMGTAVIRDVRYEVTSLEGVIDPGTDIEVVLMEDNKIYVKPVQEDF